MKKPEGVKEVKGAVKEVGEGKGALSKAQLVEYFKRRFQETDTRSDLWKELYDKEDLTLVTENHPSIIPSKLRMKMVLRAINPKRTTSLIAGFLEDFNAEMVSYKRQGRLEGLGALQALESVEEERTTKL